MRLRTLPCTFREPPCSLKKRSSVEKDIRVIREIRTEKRPSVKFRELPCSLNSDYPCREPSVFSVSLRVR